MGAWRAGDDIIRELEDTRAARQGATLVLTLVKGVAWVITYALIPLGVAIVRPFHTAWTRRHQ